MDVTWSNHKQQFKNVGLIVVQDAGEGDDILDFRKVLSPVEVHGGVGNDTIYLSDGTGSIADGGDGDDTIVASSAAGATTAILYGGAGNDKMTAGTKAITIYGDSHLIFGNAIPVTGGTSRIALGASCARFIAGPG